MNQRTTRSITFIVTMALILTATSFVDSQNKTKVLTGQGAMGDWSTDAPGVWRRITTADLPKPFESPSATVFARIAKRPEGAMPHVPAGFKVEEFASGFKNPRLIRGAQNGDLFVADSRTKSILVLRQGKESGKPVVTQIYSTERNQPVGIAF